jgi:hypothetical protein
MLEREPGAYTREDVDQLLSEVTAVLQTAPPEPIPLYDADNDTLQLFPEEAPTDVQRYPRTLVYLRNTLSSSVR